MALDSRVILTILIFPIHGSEELILLKRYCSFEFQIPCVHHWYFGSKLTIVHFLFILQPCCNCLLVSGVGLSIFSDFLHKCDYHLCTKIVFFLSDLSTFISFSYFLALARTYNMMLKRLLREDILALYLILEGKLWVSNQ